MNQVPTAALKEYRAAKRREIKSKIKDLEKQNEEMFHLWVYEKAIDEEHLRKTVRNNLVLLERLSAQYDAAAVAQATPDEINAYFNLQRMRGKL